MGILRSLILAFALSAGIAPAFAQAPPPVPALPDTERRTTYSISSSTCICSVGFQLYGDSTDVGNWIEVWINGTRISQSGNWTLSSPTGSIATIPRPITDAVLTFTGAQTGTVQIVGARRPRRTSQFSESRGVAARDLNQVITDLVTQLRENWDKTNDVTGRAVIAPPGETLAMLPLLASRANKGACFDSGGNLVPCVAIPTSTFAAGNGILLTGVNPTTITNNIQAGAGIVFTGTNPIIISSNVARAPYILPSDYGAVCDGVTNDAVALQNAITASAGKTLLLPQATCLTNSSLTVPSNIVITGGGRDVSILKSTANPAFSILNKTNVSITNIQIQGTNSVANWASSPRGPINLQQDASSVAAGANFTFSGLKLIGWNPTYWMAVTTTGSTFTLSNIFIKDNIFTSAVSSVPTDGVPANNTNALIVLQSATVGNGRIENVVIDNNQMEATGVCFGILNYANSFKFRITNNNILNPGVSTPAHCTNAVPATNVYGIAVYDLNADGNPASNGIVDSNYIYNSQASGIYWVGDGVSFARGNNSSQSRITNNLIQSQTQSDAFPRGAIVVSLTTDMLIANNALYGNVTGINIVGQSAGEISVIGNHCYTGAGSSICLRMAGGANGSSNVDRRVIRGNYFEADTAVLYSSATGNRFFDIDLSGNTIVGVTNAISMSSNFFTGNAVVANNFIRAGSVLMATITGSLTLTYNSGMSFTVATLPATTNGSSVFVSDANPATACTAGGAGSMGFRQGAAWKCF